MPFAELDATGLSLLITAICVGVGGIMTGIVTLVVGYLDRKATRREKDEDRKLAAAKELRAEARQDAQAKAVAEVKTTLEETTAGQAEQLDGIEKTGKLTHDLVNSASLVQLRLYAVAARRIAELTGDPADVEAAAVAERLHREHEAKAESATRNAERRDNKSPGG